VYKVVGKGKLWGGQRTVGKGEEIDWMEAIMGWGLAEIRKV
jgi:hypothetical protein